MDSPLSMNIHSVDHHTGFCQDLENLLSFLDKAEEVATSACSPQFVGKKTDNKNLYSFLLEPTPIRPDLEMNIRQQYAMMNYYQKRTFHRSPIVPDQRRVSAGSSFADVLFNMDDEPLDIDEAIVSPMGARSLSNDGPPMSISLLGGKPFQNTGESLPTPIRFRRYQTCQWDDRFQELLLFQQEHGHFLVPYSYPPNPKLSQWVKRQRHQYKRKQMGHHSTLTQEREELLLEAGFIFDSHRAVWQTRFDTLRAFHKANGHCGIPAKFEDGSLNVWIKHQRRQYLLFVSGEKSTMTEERIAALNSIDFDWDPRNLHRPNKA
ncbi:helicase domain protein [Nitzschia inconspicua]|uniref:Helicase domain protein n=1 Tax=Nitzschia inconspicua TaxID=303405 RepID=A0A9K3M6E4_9STRA|nr:helicase domain protein [Nitzschia inconspicua]KAG7372961.1 helicase domain protein [Nitzschia inconspicua]